MAKKYQIKVSGSLVEVTEEVYLAYYRMDRRARFLVEKDQKHGCVLYSDLDTDETTGEEMLPDLQSLSAEDVVIRNVLSEQLHQYMLMLPQEDQRLLHSLYFEGLTERQLSKQTGVPQQTIHNRKRRAIEKLRKMFEQ